MTGNIVPLLKIENVAEMMELRLLGWSYARLESRFGISAHTVRKYLEDAELYGFDYWRPEVFRADARTRARIKRELRNYQAQRC